MITPKLVGKKCYLSPLSMESARQFCRWLNDFDTAVYVNIFHKILTLKDEEKAMEYLGNTDNGNYVMSVVDREGDELIGNCGLHQVDLINRTGELGIFIGNREFRGRGYGREAVELILDFGFNSLNLHNIWLRTYSFNRAGQALFRKVGFREIGRMREAKILGDKKFDVVYMDLLRREYRSVYIHPGIEKMAKSSASGGTG